MEKIDWKELSIKPHNVIVAVTSQPDYEMYRFILLEMELYSDRYIVLEGWHCSCYNFDDTEWDAIEYTKEELFKLASSDYNKSNIFWKQVKEQIE